MDSSLWRRSGREVSVAGLVAVLSQRASVGGRVVEEVPAAEAVEVKASVLNCSEAFFLTAVHCWFSPVEVQELLLDVEGRRGRLEEVVVASIAVGNSFFPRAPNTGRGIWEGLPLMCALAC